MQLWQMVAEQETPPATQLRVLVVEDDDMCAAGLEGLFRRHCCQVEQLRDGVSGELFDPTYCDSFDLILIDWNLPGRKGDEIVQQLQAGGCPARLVMLAGLAPFQEHPEVWERLRESGIDVFSKDDGDGFAGLSDTRVILGHRLAEEHKAV